MPSITSLQKSKGAMISGKSYIRSLSANLPNNLRGTNLVFAIKDIERFSDELKEIGFSEELGVGETILPKPVGPRTEFNAEGDYEVHDDKPKETVYHQRLWTWKEWHGSDRVEKSKIVDVPYERYPRTPIDPPSVELTIAEDGEGQRLVASPSFEYTDDNEGEVLHVINMYLEIFGECAVLNEELEEVVVPEVQRRNWEFLPQGEYPWDEVKDKVEPVIEQQPEKTQPVIKKRLDTIRDHDPEFVAVGRGGFTGYLVFGFPDRDLYLLESVRKNNATYVFGEDWERLCKMSKAEILNRDLQEKRVIHRKHWPRNVRALLRD